MKIRYLVAWIIIQHENEPDDHNRRIHSLLFHTSQERYEFQIFIIKSKQNEMISKTWSCRSYWDDGEPFSHSNQETIQHSIASNDLNYATFESNMWMYFIFENVPRTLFRSSGLNVGNLPDFNVDMKSPRLYGLEFLFNSASILYESVTMRYHEYDIVRSTNSDLVDLICQRNILL
jgi:hypothetical protein